MTRARSLPWAATLLLTAVCSRPPTTRDLADRAVTAMGGIDALRAVETLQMSGGEGTRDQRGQAVRFGDPETTTQLTDVVETLDLAGGRAALEYRLTSGRFTQHRQEVLMRKGDGLFGVENVAVPGRPPRVMSPSGLFSWGTQNSPEFLLRRNAISVALAAVDAGGTGATEERELNGRLVSSGTATLPSGEAVTVFFDPDSGLLAGYEVLDTESILGDVTAQYLLADYKSVGALKLPHRVTILKDGAPYADVQFAAITVNDPSANEVFAIPSEAEGDVEEAMARAHYSPVGLVEVARRVYLARGYSHSSLVVEFPEWLAVVEAPYTEAQSHSLVRVLGERFRNKPISYVAVTHPHSDHIGGLRGLAAHGSTALGAKGHEAELRRLLESPHTAPPDELEKRRRAGDVVGELELFDDEHRLNDGDQTLELYVISGNPHSDPIVIAYVPTARVLFQSDLFFPDTGRAATPASVHLLESLRELGLSVDTHVDGHGGVGAFSELVDAVADAN